MGSGSHQAQSHPSSMKNIVLQRKLKESIFVSPRQETILSALKRKERFQSSYLYFIVPIEKNQFTPSKARKPFFFIFSEINEALWTSVCQILSNIWPFTNTYFLYLCFCEVCLLYRQHCVANQFFSKFSQENRTRSEHAIEYSSRVKHIKETKQNQNAALN